MVRMHILFAGLALSSCSEASENALPETPTEASAQTPIATPSATTNSIPASEVIQPFVGSWRPSSDLCGDMSEYGLDITASRLVYYEFSGQIGTVRQNPDGSISVSILATIEGEEGGSSTETIKTQFSLSADRQGLTEVNQWGDSRRYIRCP